MASIALPLSIISSYSSVSMFLDKNKSRLNYDNTKSSSYNATPNYDSLSYVGGYVSGQVGQDIATFGNSSSLAATITVQYSTWASLATSGFLGLSFSTLANYGNNIQLHLYKESLGLKAPTFMMYLGSGQPFDVNTSPPNNGVLQFGATEEDAAPYALAPLTWINVAPDVNYQNRFTLWMASMDSISYFFDPACITNNVGVTRSGLITPNSTSGTITIPVGGRAILDSGAGLASVPASVAESLYAAIGLNYTFFKTGGRPLCEDLASVKSVVTFTIGGMDFTLTARDLAKPGYTEDKYCWFVKLNYI
ncbi:hypothetical protein HDU93_004702 [Gonapodya sp. JEL0774]|nr:hypothetical protein HDU93_004702 [Gonapodya sp. JEL0774]